MSLFRRWKNLRLHEVGLLCQSSMKSFSMTQHFDKAQVVSNLAKARIEFEGRCRESRKNGKSHARAGASKHGRDSDQRTLISQCLQYRIRLAREDVGRTQRPDGPAQITKRAGCGDQSFESGVAGQNIKGKSTGKSSDTRSGNTGVKRGDQRRDMNRGTKSLGVLK